MPRLSLTVLRNVTKEDTVQYVLAVLDDLLQGACPPYIAIGSSDAHKHRRMLVVSAQGTLHGLPSFTSRARRRKHQQMIHTLSSSGTVYKCQFHSTRRCWLLVICKVHAYP